MLNNYTDQSTNEPVECSVCFSSMSVSYDGERLICDKMFCSNEIELKGKSDE